MASHVEYVADQDVDQLEHLIAVAKAKMDELQLGGWVRLWVVADDVAQGWFELDDYQGAITLLLQLAQKHLSEGNCHELSIEQCQYRKAEAQRLVAETSSTFFAQDATPLRSNSTP